MRLKFHSFNAEKHPDMFTFFESRHRDRFAGETEAPTVYAAEKKRHKRFNFRLYKPKVWFLWIQVVFVLCYNHPQD